MVIAMKTPRLAGESGARADGFFFAIRQAKVRPILRAVQ
jgi:hypothetical protein